MLFHANGTRTLNTRYSTVHVRVMSLVVVSHIKDWVYKIINKVNLAPLGWVEL